MSDAKSEASIGDLLGSLATNTGTLVRQELQLASTEMSQKAKTAAVDTSLIGVGAALTHVGVIFVVFGVVMALAALVPMWISALAIGVLCVGGGLAVASRGVSALRSIDPTPRQTVRTLGSDEAWLKEQVR